MFSLRLVFACLVLSLPPFFSGCGGGPTSESTEATGSRQVPKEEAAARAVQFSYNAASLAAQALLDRTGVQAEVSPSKFSSTPHLVCPEAVEAVSRCDIGDLVFSLENCSVDPGALSDLMSADLRGQFRDCSDSGLILDGDFFTDVEWDFSPFCLSDSLEPSCLDSSILLKGLIGGLEVTDEGGTFWDVTFLSGSFYVEWTREGTRFFRILRGRMVDAELDLHARNGSRFRCVIHEDVAECHPDADGDGIADDEDNCPENANANQQDVDGDGIGDACDDANVPCSVPPVCEDSCQAFLDACPNIAERLANFGPLGSDLACLEGSCIIIPKAVPLSECVEPSPPPENLPCPSGASPGECGVVDDCFGQFAAGTAFLACIGGCCGIDSDQDGFLGTGLVDLFVDKDNCPEHPNPGQEDCDGDLLGDACDTCPKDSNPFPFQTGFENDPDLDFIPNACDPDDDNDGLIDESDPCPFNASQDSTDGDGDGVPNVCDNCPAVANPGQEDSDIDLDNNPRPDGIGDSCDNCPQDENPDQFDQDNDGLGDNCDPDREGDGVEDVIDNCPSIFNPDQVNGDGDLSGDDCDNCPSIPNELQNDFDVDGLGDACDPDIDEDGLENASDNCLYATNPDQTDSNEDGVGDACDLDSDGIEDQFDNCPGTFNPDQTDGDGNGRGDACESDGGPGPIT